MSKIVTYKNDKYRCFCEIKLDSGERILISIATIPTPSIKVSKLAIGLVPVWTIWEYNPTMAGGYEAYARKTFNMFVNPEAPKHPLDSIVDTLLPCKSIEEVRNVFLEAERLANSSASESTSNISSEKAGKVPSFIESLLILANKLRAETGFEVSNDISDAIVLVATHIVTGAQSNSGIVSASGPGFTGNTIGAIFLCFVTSPIVIHAKNEGYELSINDIVARAGFTIYQMYDDKTAAKFISDGIEQYKTIIQAGSIRENIREYTKTINEAVYVYIISGDEKLLEAFGKLYMTIVNAQEDLHT